MFLKKHRKTKKSFVKDSSNPSNSSSRTKKVPCNCNKCKGQMVDPRTKKSHESKKDIGPRGIIDDISIDLNQDSLIQDTLIDFPDVIDTSSDNDQEIEPVPYEENYLFLLKKQSKNNSKRVSNNIFNPVVVIEQDTSDDNNDNKSDSSEVNSEKC